LSWRDAFSCGGGNSLSEFISFISLFKRKKLPNELSKKAPVGKVLKLLKFSFKPEQPGLSSLLCYEVMSASVIRIYINPKYYL